MTPWQTASTCAQRRPGTSEIELHGHRVVLPPRRRGAADRADPRDHRPLRPVGARRSSSLGAEHTRCWRPTCSATASRRSRAATTRSAPTRARVRDTMVALGHDRATIVGHSLGGGIAMQFAYQFPERCERLVLVSSGGLGREVHPLLRAATLPGSEYVLPLLTHARVLGGRRGGRPGARRAAAARPAPTSPRSPAASRSLGDAEARSAFIETMRAVLDPGGQRVSALDRLYLAESVPSLIVWGSADPIIPAAHGRGRARGDARQPARGPRRRRPLPPAGAAAPVRRACWRTFVAETEAARARHDDDPRPADRRRPGRLGPAYRRRFSIRSSSRPTRCSTASVITSWNIARRASEASGRRRSSASRTAGRSVSGLPWSSIRASRPGG